ncbi:MAG: DUF393 domain-containing protein [Parcubacteria group bacterium]|nr:DUF393 domain-containing protein [Parcubacteria group bacterium]
MQNYSIILFDGECNLCDKSVTFILDRDPKKKFKFASIQSNVGKKLIQKCGGDPDNVTAMYVIEGEKCYSASTAALRIARGLSWPWPLFYYILIFVPPFIRNIGYYIISKTRARIFGKVNTCRVMTPEIEERFLSA